MSTTVSQQHHHHMPLIASLSVAGVIAAAAAVGVAWHESGASDTHQAPSQGAPAAQSHLPSGQAMGGVDGHTPPTPPQRGGGRTQIAP